MSENKAETKEHALNLAKRLASQCADYSISFNTLVWLNLGKLLSMDKNMVTRPVRKTRDDDFIPPAWILSDMIKNGYEQKKKGGAAC